MSLLLLLGGGVATVNGVAKLNRTPDFFDDWEAGNTSKWATVTGSPVVGTAYKDTGAYGQRLVAANSQNLVGTGTAKWAQTHPWFSTIHRVKFISLSNATARTPVITIQNTNQADNVDVGIDHTNGHWVLDIANADAVTAAFGPNLNQWYTVQVRGYFGTGGTWYAWLMVDGVEILSTSSSEATGFFVRAVTLGTAATNLSFEEYVDNFQIVVDDADIGWPEYGGKGTLLATGHKNLTGAATLTGTGSSTTAGVRTRFGAGALTGAGTSTTAGVRTRLGAAALTGTGTQTVAAVHTAVGAAALTGVGTLNATAIRTTSGTSIDLTGAGTATVAGVRTRFGTVTLSGTGSATVGAVHTVVGAGALTGTGTLTSTATYIATGAAALTGTGVLIVNTTHIEPQAAAYTGAIAFAHANGTRPAADAISGPHYATLRET